MKRAIAAMTALGLIVGAMAAPAAVAKKKKKKNKAPVVVQVDQQFFLRDSDGCDTSDNLLSITDGPDTGCWYVDAGVTYDAITGTGLLSKEDLASSWTAIDGAPFTLDTSKPLAGEITTTGGACVIAGGCSPVPLSGGQASLWVSVIATIDGTEVELGTYSESYVVAPTVVQTVTFDIELDAALEGATVTALRVLTYQGGAAVGHGVVVLDDPASFVTVPTLVTQ